MHTVIDEHSHVAYTEIHRDEKADTTVGARRRVVAWLAERGRTVARVLSDNGTCHRSHVWRDTCTDLQMVTNGPVPTG